MVLQSSGAISLANIQTEFGGANPIGINEYYLNGVYTTGSGATGVPTSGAISLGSFYGKSKISTPSWPMALQSDYNNFGKPWGTQDTYYLWQNGASGTNLTRTGGMTFNNLGADGQNRASFINYQGLILQAKPGDILSFQLKCNSLGLYQIVNTLLINLGGGWVFFPGNLGGGWFVAGSATSFGGRTDTITYTVPSTTAPGNYGIEVYCDYNTQNNSYYSSANFYSLHVVS